MTPFPRNGTCSHRFGAESETRPLVARRLHCAVLPGEDYAVLEMKRRATYEDVLAVPPHKIAEIVNGELVVSPRPGPRHTLVSSMLGAELIGPFHKGREGPGGWWILDEPEIHFIAGEPLVPDLAGWRRDRMPELPETAWFGLAPDWLCEVLSPSTAAVDRIEKMPIYANASVAHAWLIDPALQSLEVFRLHERRWLLAGTFRGNVKVRAEPFAAIELELGSLWAAATSTTP